MKTSLSRRLAWAASLAAACIQLGCHDDERIAGGGTEQPNEIVGRVTDADGKPASAAHVFLHAGDFTPDADSVAAEASRVLGEAVCDSAGRFTSTAAPSGSFYLEIQSSDSAQITVVPVPGKPSDHALDLPVAQLIPASGLRGSIHQPITPVYAFALAGTHYRAAVTAAGTFRFPPVLPGRYSLFALVEKEDQPYFLVKDSVLLLPGKTLSLDSLQIPNDSLPLFDFETTPVRSALRGILYPRSDSTAGRWETDNGFVNNIPLEAPDSELTLTSQGAYRGHSLRIAMKANRHYMFNLGRGYYDFTRVQALAFYARSTDDTLPLTVSFHTEAVSNTGTSFTARVQPLVGWSKLSIAASDIRRDTVPDTLTWAQASSAVVRIAIRSTKDRILWLDDIHLIGITYADLALKNP